jgi:hypothetical protein
LALDNDQRHAFARQLDGVCVPELVWCNRRRTPAAAAVARRSVRAAALDQWRPAVAPLMMQTSGPTGSSVRNSDQGQKFFPAPRVHPDLAASSALAAPDQHGAATVIEICLGEQGLLGCAARRARGSRSARGADGHWRCRRQRA